jgi:hypothetical protein
MPWRKRAGLGSTRRSTRTRPAEAAAGSRFGRPRLYRSRRRRGHARRVGQSLVEHLRVSEGAGGGGLGRLLLARRVLQTVETIAGEPGDEPVKGLLANQGIRLAKETEVSPILIEGGLHDV